MTQEGLVEGFQEHGIVPEKGKYSSKLIQLFFSSQLLPIACVRARKEAAQRSTVSGWQSMNLPVLGLPGAGASSVEGASSGSIPIKEAT